MKNMSMYTRVATRERFPCRLKRRSLTRAVLSDFGGRSRSSLRPVAIGSSVYVRSRDTFRHRKYDALTVVKHFLWLFTVGFGGDFNGAEIGSGDYFVSDFV